jgi:hypothetical protein
MRRLLARLCASMADAEKIGASHRDDRCDGGIACMHPDKHAVV